MSEQLRQAAKRQGYCMDCADQGKQVKATQQHFATLFCAACWDAKPKFVNQAHVTQEG